MDRRDVANWIAHYEHAWRSPGTHELEALFTPGALYSQGPYRDPVEGLEAIARMWEAERSGPDEQFTMTSALVALDEEVAVARVEVHYHQTGEDLARPVGHALRRRRAVHGVRGVAHRARPG